MITYVYLMDNLELNFDLKWHYCHVCKINEDWKLKIIQIGFKYKISGAAVKMDHFQAALDPRKQELLEARFLGARVSDFQHSIKQKPNGIY